jgi:ABC-type transporter Mla subunit MlaD
MPPSSSDVRDGFIFLAGLLLLLSVIIALTRVAQDGDMYVFKIRFARAQNLQSGAVVQVSGVPVGQVTQVALQPGTNQSLVSVKIYDRVALTRDDIYTIATGGLVGEKYIDITPQAGGQRVRPGAIVVGASSPDVNDLFAATNNLLTKLNATADGINGLIGDSQEQQSLKQALRDFERTAATSAALADNLNSQVTANRTEMGAMVTDLHAAARASKAFAAGLDHFLQRNQTNLDATVAGLRQTTTSSAELTSTLHHLVQRNAQALDGFTADLTAVSTDLRQLSATLTPQLSGTKMLQNLESAAEKVASLTERLDHTAASVDLLLGDEELAGNLRASAQHMRQASVELGQMMGEARQAIATFPSTAADLQSAAASAKEAMGNMKEASVGMKSSGSDLPLITRPFREVAPETAANVLDVSRALRKTSTDLSGVTEKLTRLGSGLSKVRLEPDGRIMVLGDSPHPARADLHLDLRGRTLQARVGLTNIGTETRATAQLGQHLTPALRMRYGVMQSKFGVGLDYAPSRALRLTGDLFDPGTPRANVQADYRLPGLGDAWWVSAGWYDLLDSGHTPGVGLVYRPGPAGE